MAVKGLFYATDLLSLSRLALDSVFRFMSPGLPGLELRFLSRLLRLSVVMTHSPPWAAWLRGSFVRRYWESEEKNCLMRHGRRLDQDGLKQAAYDHRYNAACFRVERHISFLTYRECY